MQWRTPRFQKPRFFALAAALVVVLCPASTARACNIPVFRYALEHWRPDPFRVAVVHRGPLGEAERAAIARLQSAEDDGLANLRVRLVDAGNLEHAEDTALRDAAVRGADSAREAEDPPTLVVQYPESFGVDTILWTAPLDDDSLARLADSPRRRELVRLLAEGRTAVWLVLDGGDESKDAAAAALVAAEVKRLETSLKLPELTDTPEDALLGGPLPPISFAVLRVPRGAEEAALVSMLVHSEPDLAGRSDPIAFPVFGRGRALLPLVGKGITERNVQEAAVFLTGACSCQVKEQNPGFDLLLGADWSALLSRPGVAPVAGAEASASSELELVSIPPGSSARAEPPPPLIPDLGSSPRLNAPPPADRSRNLAVVGGILVVVGGAIAAARGGKPRS